MATTGAQRKSYDEVELAVELPENREYEDPIDAKLDEKLVETIAAAQEVENDYLVTILSHELGSHYYDTR